MKAYAIKKYSKSQPLELIEQSVPKPTGSQVLIKVHSAGVNVLDVKIKHGEFKQILKYDMPLVLGNDVAGVITDVGENVKKFKIGDEVYAYPGSREIGTFREYTLVSESALAVIPKNIPIITTSGVPLVALTAWQVLVEVAKVQPGQRVFIQAGSGGVGSIAIQIAKHLGAYVATTASAKNEALLRELGADIVIDYQTQDFEMELKNYDVVLHSQDTQTLEKSLRVLRPGGYLVSISGPPDPAYAKTAGLPLVLQFAIKGLSFKVRKAAKNLGVHYSFLLVRPDGTQLQKITKLIELGIIKPQVDTVYTFSETQQALDHVESGRSKGKVIIKIAD
jgi:NADPH:quinone reductase-like Zn-dependent oxidoreductase